MHELEPDQRVIALIHRAGAWRYYAADKETWVMDLPRFQRAFEARGYACPPLDPDTRGGVLVLDEQTAPTFLAHVAPSEQDPQRLRQRLREAMPIAHWDQVSPLFPAVLIDFETRRLLSTYSEGLSYEDFVPDGWQGAYEDFFAGIPAEHRYWLDGALDYFQIAVEAGSRAG